MKLADWAKKGKWSQSAIADAIGSSQGHISNLMAGKVKPTTAMISRIEVLTKGQVAYPDWVEKKPWKKPQITTRRKR